MTDTPQLPNATKKRFEEEATTLAKHVHAADYREYQKMIRHYSVGAEVEARRALLLVEALENIRKILNEWTNESNSAWNIAHNALEQYNQTP